MGYAEAVAFILKRWHWFVIAGLCVACGIQRGQVKRAKGARDDARREVAEMRAGIAVATANYRKEVARAQADADARGAQADEWQRRYKAAAARRPPPPKECQAVSDWLAEHGRAVRW